MLVHAWGESGSSFDRLIELLPPSLVPTAIDLPGHGAARVPAASYSVRDLAAHLAVVLEGLNSSAPGWGKAVVLGSSSGGYLAQQLAVDHPELLDGLVLVGSPISLQGRPPFADDVERLTDPVEADWVRKSLSWFPLHHSVPGTYVEDRVRDGTTIPARVWRESMEGLYLATPPLETGSITVPTLVIGAGSDELLGHAHLHLVEAIPQARGVVYEDAGHLVLWERPAQVAADVASFVDTLGSAD